MNLSIYLFLDLFPQKAQGLLLNSEYTITRPGGAKARTRMSTLECSVFVELPFLSMTSFYCLALASESKYVHSVNHWPARCVWSEVGERWWQLGVKFLF